MSQLMSENINELATALSKAQGEMTVAGKNQKNPFFKSSYADLEAIIAASRPALSKYGLSVIQSPVVDEHNVSFLITMLLHSSGQWIKSKAMHNPQKQDVQSLSSYNTYLKRMCYTSLIGVVVGEDDDGNAASEPARHIAQQPYTQNVIAEKISKEQLEQLEYELEKHPSIKQRILTSVNIDNLSEMPKSSFLRGMARIRELINLEPK